MSPWNTGIRARFQMWCNAARGRAEWPQPAYSIKDTGAQNSAWVNRGVSRVLTLLLVELSSGLLT